MQTIQSLQDNLSRKEKELCDLSFNSFMEIINSHKVGELKSEIEKIKREIENIKIK